MDVAVAPPLPSWPAQAFPFEPAHGWFQRLAARNAVYSAGRLATLHALNGRNLDHAELLDFCLRFPARDMHHLTAATPIPSEARVIVSGQVFSRKLDFTVRRPRVCPGCLREERYYRNWFDLQSLGICPIHRERLVSGSEGDRLAWWHPHVGVTPSGRDLAEEALVGVSDCAWEEYVLARMGAVPGGPLTWLDGYTIDEITRVSVAIAPREDAAARKGSRSQTQRAQLAAGGFALLSDGTEALMDVSASLERRARRGDAHANQEAQRLTATLPHLAGELAQAVASAVQRGRRLSAPRSRRVGKMSEGESETIDLKRLAASLNLSSNKTRVITERLGLGADGVSAADRYEFTLAEQEKVRHAVHTSVSRAEAAFRIGLTAEGFKMLVKGGHVAPLCRIGLQGAAGERYLLSDLDDLSARLRAKRPERPINGVAFLEYCMMAKTTGGEVACGVLDGTLELASLDQPGKGFAACRIVVDDQARAAGLRRRGRKSQAGMSYGDAAAAIGCMPNAIGPLVSAGYLTSVNGAHGILTGVCAGSVSAFADEYAPSRLYGPATGLSPAGVTWAITKADMQYLKGEGLDRHRFLRRHDVETVLGWRLEPADGLVRDVRDALVGQFMMSNSANKVLADSGQIIRLKSGDAKLTAAVDVDSAAKLATFAVEAKKTASSRRYDILRDRQSELLKIWPDAEIAHDRCKELITVSQRYDLAGGSSDIESAALAIDKHMILVRQLLLS